MVECLPKISDCKKHAYGLDFGFTNDPSVLSEFCLNNGEIWLRELFYERGLVNRITPNNPKQRSIEAELIRLNIPKESHIWCDSAEPKSIQDLINAGWIHARPATKGPDSIRQGLDLMKRYRINLTYDSMNAIKEKNNYKWKEAKDGQAVNTPIDAFNDFWDSARYASTMELANTDGQPTGTHMPDDVRRFVFKTPLDRVKYYERRNRSDRNFD
jgi:phage terminase large subunit